MKLTTLATAALLTMPTWAQQGPEQKESATVADAVEELSPVTDPSISVRPPAVQETPIKIVLVGDSTTQVESGWGGEFCSHHVIGKISCIDLGRGGRSSYSYRAEGAWALALREMSIPGYKRTYVLIQFGHNDMPGRPGRSTNLAIEFPANLRAFVKEARAAGAVPVLLTPLSRRQFSKGVLVRDLAPWADAVRKVAKEMNVPLVDLYARSAAVVQFMGPVEASKLAAATAPDEVLGEAGQSGNTIAVAKPQRQPQPTPVPGGGAAGSNHLTFDYTHVGRDGAILFSAIVADGLARAVPDLQMSVIP